MRRYTSCWAFVAEERPHEIVLNSSRDGDSGDRICIQEHALHSLKSGRRGFPWVVILKPKREAMQHIELAFRTQADFLQWHGALQRPGLPDVPAIRQGELASPLLQVGARDPGGGDSSGGDTDGNASILASVANHAWGRGAHQSRAVFYTLVDHETSIRRADFASLHAIRLQLRDSAINQFFFTLFIFYPLLTTKIGELFQCIQLGYDETALLHDLALSCDSTTYAAYRAANWCFLAIYVFGIPLFFAFIFFKNVHIADGALIRCACSELCKVAPHIGDSYDNITAEAFMTFDMDRDGKLQFDEFCAAMRAMKQDFVREFEHLNLASQSLRPAFDYFDTESAGVLTAKQIHRFVQMACGDENSGKARFRLRRVLWALDREQRADNGSADALRWQDVLLQPEICYTEGRLTPQEYTQLLVNHAAVSPETTPDQLGFR